MKYFLYFFVSIDQLGNVLAGGLPDNTVSSRIGYYTNMPNPKWYWLWFQKIVDFTFYPVDGEGHCHEAYFSEAGTKYDESTKNWGVAILFIFILLSCALIIAIFYPLYFLKIISPKNINRNVKIQERIEAAVADVNGSLHELNEHMVEIDPKLKPLADQLINKAQELRDKLGQMKNRP